MELITHALTGFLIQLLCFIYLPIPLAIIFTIIFGFFSHFIIDTLAKLTYHTPEPHKEDKFWVIWHVLTLVLVFVLLIWIIFINWVYFFFFLLGGIAANLVDIWDWMILRPKQNKVKANNPEAKFWGETLYIHPLIDWFRSKTMFWAPDWNEEKKGVIIEIITISILWILVAIFFGIYIK